MVLNHQQNLKKVKHTKPMLSLGNAFEKKDIIDFKKKISNFLNFRSDIQFSAEPKIDGISSTLRYEKGDLTFWLIERRWYFW